MCYSDETDEESSESSTESVDEDFAKPEADCHPTFKRDIQLMREKWGEKSVSFRIRDESVFGEAQVSFNGFDWTRWR